jgi:hypothetical protein
MVRLAFVVGAQIVTIHPDTPSYQRAPDFFGGDWRPWLYPLINWLLPNVGVVIFQTALSAVAFVALAFAVASTMRTETLRAVAVLVVLLLGASTRNTLWDSYMLTESIAVSLTALVIAALIYWERVPGWAWLTLFACWIFTRDAHLYLGALLLAGCVILAWHHRRPVALIGMVVVMVWAVLAGQRNHDSEHYAVTVNVAFHAGRDVDKFVWFVDEGMPVSAGFLIPDFNDRFSYMLGDPEFQDWVAREGAATYARYLATHPAFTLGALRSVFVDRGIAVESLVDETYWHLADDEPAGVPWVWPADGNLYTLVLVAASIVGSLLVLLGGGGLDRRWILPAVLMMSTVPHALLAYHGTPWELARHGVVPAFVLVISAVWVIGLASDRALVAQLARRDAT